jgi:hypothetical protein
LSTDPVHIDDTNVTPPSLIDSSSEDAPNNVPKTDTPNESDAVNPNAKKTKKPHVEMVKGKPIVIGDDEDCF